jgi:deazaflavin-dependent oxidoreductase (nitroreductase family)
LELQETDAGHPAGENRDHRPRVTPGRDEESMALKGEYAPSPQDWVRKQVETFESSNGQEGGLNQGVPIIVLTTVGAKTGKLRKIPLMRVEHDGGYLAVASLGGAPKNPVWYYNVLAHPEVELQDGSERHTLRAREITDPQERAAWWERAVAVWPDYANYQKKTDRVIPLFVLEPTGREA